MKKRVKSISSIFLILVVVLIVAAVAVNLLADRLLGTAVETAGTKALNVGVDVGRAKLSILSGRLGLGNVTVSNPPGYEHETLLTLDKTDVSVDAKSLLTDEVRMKDVRLDGMHVVMEQKGLSNNLYDVIEPLQRDRSASGKRLYIDDLKITDVTVTVKLLPVPGQVDTVTLQLEPIEMTDLGHNERLDIATLTVKIILAVTAGVAKQGADVLPKETLIGLSTVLDSAIDIGRVIFGTGRNNGEGGQKGTEDITKEITEGLKGILGPKKEE